MKHVLIAAFALTAHTALAESYDYSKRWGIGASFGYNTPVFGNPLNNAADSDVTWGLHARYHINSFSGLELGHTRHEFSDTTLNAKVTDVTYFHRLSALARFTPVLGAGLGVVDLGNYEPNNLKLGIKLRAGAEYALTNDLSLGLNIDYQHLNKMFFAKNLPSRNGHILAAKVGLTYYFGGAATTATAASAVANTKNAYNTDSDDDGVVDAKDKCPNTAKATKVNAYGCSVSEKASIKIDVKFDSGKSTLDQSYTSDLKELASFMNEHKKTKVEIQGHTDSTGSKQLNKELSQKRADAVKSYLVNNLKVDAKRVKAVGYGFDQPIADNSTVEGKQQNRRVIAIINE